MEKTLDQRIDAINTLLFEKNFDSAENEALSLLDVNPDSAVVLNILGNVYLNKKDFPKAIHHLELANTISNSGDGHILFNLAVAYSNSDRGKALSYLKEAKILLPNEENIIRFEESLGNE